MLLCGLRTQGLRCVRYAEYLSQLSAGGTIAEIVVCDRPVSVLLWRIAITEIQTIGVRQGSTTFII